jgi:hypothetical protein
MTNDKLIAHLLLLLTKEHIGDYFMIDGIEYLFDTTDKDEYGSCDFILDRVQGADYSVRAGTLSSLAAKFVHEVHPEKIA